MAEQKGKYQPWSHEEFMADRKVRRMSPTALKTYMMLLHEAFVCETRPHLPDDEEELEAMAYCTDRGEWLSVRDSVLGMFNREVIDGVPVLTKKRLIDDWETLQAIRETKSQAGIAGAKKRWGSRNSTFIAENSTNGTPVAENSKEVSKEVKKERKEKEENTSDSSFQNDGQEDEVNLKAFKAEITSAGVERGIKVHGYDSQWSDLKILSTSHGSQAVINDFGDFLDEGGEYPKGALTSYLWVAADRLVSGSPAASLASAKDPDVVSLVRELTYASDGQIAFLDKQRVRLAEVLKEFSAAEIKSAFSAWLGDQDLSDAKNLPYLPGKFVQIADGLCYSARRRKQESEAAKVQRAVAAVRLQEEAEAERQRAEVEKQKEAEIFDPLA